MGMARRFRVDMEILRIVEPPEGDDFILGEGVAAQIVRGVEIDFFEPAGHWMASGSRISTRLARLSVITCWPFWLRMSKATVRMPMSGWLAERRRAVTVAVPERVSPFIRGRFHLRSEKPSPPIEAILERKPSTSMRSESAPVRQPLAASP